MSLFPLLRRATVKIPIVEADEQRRQPRSLDFLDAADAKPIDRESQAAEQIFVNRTAHGGMRQNRRAARFPGRPMFVRLSFSDLGDGL
jgi:hypothetical protein